MYRLQHDELAWWTERYRNHGQLQRKRDAAAASLRACEDALREQALALQLRQHVLARLEHSPWSRVVAQLRGGWAETMDRERRLHASIEERLHQLECDAAQARQQLERLECELADLGDVGAGYRRALEAKARTLASSADAHGRLVTELMQALLKAQSRIRDLVEASASGRSAYESLDRLLRRVSPSGRGAARPRPGYAIVVETVHAAQEDLRAFLRSLAALHELGPSHREAVTTFSDTFFERLIEQWAKDPRGHGAAQTVRRVQHRVNSILQQIDRGRQAVEQDQSGLWERFVTVVRAG